MKKKEKTLRLEISVKPRSKFPGIDKSNPDRWVIGIKEPAIEGRANEAIRALIASEFGVSKSSVEIIIGMRSKHKVIRIHGK